jgi:hypothetical protein
MTLSSLALRAASFNGVLTANAGVVVDNFTLDGTTLALSSGDLTLDVAGDIILDAGGAQLRFYDDGADIGVISNESNNLIIKTQVSDADMLFKGNDGGSTITALTLDMSDGGNATFNKDILLGDDSAIRLGASQDLALFHDATDSTIRNNTGDLILDVAGDIILDAGGGDVIFKEGGALRGSLKAGTNAAFELKSLENNAEFIIKGIDNNAEITALTLDMSEAGEATFNSDIKLNDGKVARFGTDQDFRIGFDGTDAVLQNVTSDSDITFSKATMMVHQSPPSPLICLMGGTATFYRKIIVSAADGVADADYVASFTNNESTSGRSFGLSIGAGTSGSDIALNVVNQAGDTTLLRVHGNGATTIGNSLTLADGNLVVAAGHGIDFSAVTGTALVQQQATLLDDYEEGTWTPIPKRYNDGVGGDITTTGSITVSDSRYTKIGNIVYLYCQINITGTITQGTSDTQIRNIPFLPTKRYNAGAIGPQSALTDNPNDSGGFSADNVYNALTTGIANPWVAGILSISVFYQTDA